MDKAWTLHIEKLGKISSADVRLARLMCFVGDNNSGKSYLMSILWGILTLGKDIFPKAPSESKSYKKCESWLKDNLNRDTEITDSVAALYIQWFNDLLNSNKKLLVRRIFNYDVDIEKLEIKDYVCDKNISLQWSEQAARYSSTRQHIKFPKISTPTKDDILRMNAYICWNLLMEGIAAPLFTPLVKGRRTGEPIYLPASRTGFMLTYPQLIENSLSVTFSSLDNNTSKLTLPYIDFLQLITKFETNGKSKKAQPIIDFIEKNMTQGNLTITKQNIPLINYIPSGTSKELPLYLASSIVSEISPILLVLKSNIKFNVIIIEEPEAHLHPNLQKKMAQLIINLMNAGFYVWITTHSDTIIQHINNMIKLKNNTDSETLMEKFDYSKEDLLAGRDVLMYQFVKDGTNHSKLIELELTDYGFVVPTFNNALEKIIDEVYAFQEE